VQEVDDAAALSLSLLRRRGYAVTVLVNQAEEEYLDTAARLAAHHLPTLPLHDENGITAVSRKWYLEGSR
jgi:hypothetical protein